MRKLYTLVVLLCVFFSSCSDDIPWEEEIRELLEAAVEAAEKNEISTLNDFVAKGYRDTYGNVKRDIRRIVAGYYFRNKTPYILMHINSMNISNDDEVNAILYVAFSNQPIPNIKALSNLRADLYETHLRLVKSKSKWKVTSSKWVHLSKSDFMSKATESRY